jgi:hypothetical protein
LRMLYEGFNRRVGMLAKSLENIPGYAADAHILRALDLYYSVGAGRMGEELDRALGQQPENMQALFLMVTDKLDDIALGRAPERFSSAAARLNGSAAQVILGWTLLHESAWSELARLDAGLSDANVSDLWYSKATRLRARWRIELAEQGTEPDTQFASEALTLIDNITSINSDTDLYLLRARAARILADRDTFIDSSWSVVNEIWRIWNNAWDGYTDVSTGEYAEMYRAAATLQSGLESGTFHPGQRDDEMIRLNLQQVMSELSAYSRD